MKKSCVPSVIRDILEEKVAEIQNNEARNVGRKAKQELTEQTTDDLLHRAIHAAAAQKLCLTPATDT